MDKNKIATRTGFVGGGVFFILNFVTKGQVPGGFIGGVMGFIVGYALAWLVLAFIPSKKKTEDSDKVITGRVVVQLSKPIQETTPTVVRTGLSATEVEQIMGSPKNITSD